MDVPTLQATMQELREGNQQRTIDLAGMGMLSLEQIAAMQLAVRINMVLDKLYDGPQMERGRAEFEVVYEAAVNNMLHGLRAESGKARLMQGMNGGPPTPNRQMRRHPRG